MVKSTQAGSVSDRLERSYLSLLRGLTLVAATICIVGAVIFAIDGTRRALTSTKVDPAPVTISSDDALRPIIQSDASGKDAAKDGASAATDHQRKVLAAFLAGPFETYFQSYKNLAARHNKAEDQTLTKEQLADHLGYTLDALTVEDAPLPAADVAADDTTGAAGFALTAERFITDKAHAQAQVAAVTKAATDTRVVNKARGYHAAQKSAQTCRTEYETRTVWDENSTICRNWYTEPYGCSVRREVPVQKCEATYPEGIQSPLDLFSLLDASYRLNWYTKTEAAEDEAAATLAEKEAVKAAAPISFMRALQVAVAFLVIMFLFLLIAIERHLRRVAVTRDAAILANPDPVAEP